MVSVLDDESLCEFIGGRPRTLEQLRETYARQAVGQSPDEARGWLNWIARERATGSVVGKVQATLRDSGGAVAAELAWVIGSRHQGNGFAKEAATGMLSWLQEQHVGGFSARIHRGHRASIAVARHLGLSATDEVIDGEILWASQRSI
jgi:RimJ/RimL family protein N-acetyltransferase